MTTTDTTYPVDDPDRPIPYVLAAVSDQQVVVFERDEALDDERADLPLEALVDVVTDAIKSCEMLIDTLPTLRQRTMNHPDTYAYDMHVRRAYLDAEEKAANAWRDLQHAQQLIKGLAR